MEMIALMIEYAKINKFVQTVVIAVMLDTVLGVLRAVKEKKFNSSAGIDGAIRKVTMLICIMFLLVIDRITGINLIGFLPDAALEIIKIKNIGATEFFSILYALYEAVSILKNMALCGLPMPAKLRNFICNFLDLMTDEMPVETKNND